MLPVTRRSLRPSHLAFMAVLGLFGWGLLIAVSVVPDLGPVSVAHPDWLAFTMFLIVIVAARAMAVPLLGESVVSLDAGFYIAAAVCLGSVTAGCLVAIALFVDAVFRLAAEGKRRERGVRVWVEAAIYGIYFGGMSGALLMALAWAFDLDSLYVVAEVADLHVLGKVVAVGLCLLVAHYAIQGARLWLLGESVGSYVERMAMPGIVAETALLPLAAIVIFLYHPDQPLKFALLGATYLLITYAFNRLSTTSALLRQRVVELETLEATARRLAASLHIHELVETVARETMAALPEAEMLTLAYRAEGAGDELVVEVFDRERKSFERTRASAKTGVTSLVVSSGHGKYLPDLSTTDLDLDPDAGIRSWMGVPMRIHGSVEGVLAAQSRKPYVFSPEHLRLLEAIGAQAAVSLQNARLYELAMVDGLTKLYVRRYLDARLDEEIQRTARFGSEFSIIMMDIDDFKHLNDTCGHVAGDRVLRAVADVVKQEMRGVDTAARYGGEEIAMILPRTAMVDAYNQAERIRARIEAFPIAVDSGDVISVTASFGIASHPESGATDAESLVALADRALYRAKKTGKNRVELYWPPDAQEQPKLRPA